MKNILLLKTILFLSATSLYAQLNGTYTIGGTTPDYATFTAAVADLMSAGVSGAVTFDVRNGTYAEKISIGAIPGASAFNSVTFQSETGDSTAVILTDPATSATGNNYTLQLSGADFIVFKKMTIERSGSGTYATVIEISNGAIGNKFLNNRINGVNASASSTNNSLVYSPTGATSIDTNNIFTSNFFEGGSYGMYFNGASATVLEGRTTITNNIFRNQYARFISMQYQSNANISGNDLMTSSVYATMYGIYLSSAVNGLVARNKVIFSSGSGYAVYMTSVDGNSNAPFNLVNNMVHIGGNGTAYGIYLSGCTYFEAAYNTVNLTGSGTTSRCLYVTGAASLGIDIIDNVFSNPGGGYAYYVVGTATSGIHLSNYNDLYTTGANLGFWTSAVPDLTSFQTASGMESNSISVDPVFYAATDLHVSGSAINDLGTPLTAFNTDIDGDVRSAVTPDMGADEFVPLADNVGLLALAAPLHGGCGDSSTAIAVVIKNFGLNPQTGIPVNADITGAVTQTLSGTYTGTLNQNAQDTFYFPQTIVTAAGGSVNITAYTSLGTDQYLVNDTIHAMRMFYAIPSPPGIVSPQQQCDNHVSISAMADSGNVIYWYDQPGGNLLFTGSPFTPLIFSDTAFYVSQHQGSGSTGCLRISECGLGTNDFLEIENLSGSSIDATGWVAVISNSYSDINLMNANVWNLGMFNPGEIQYQSDVANDNYWGSNMLWNPGSNSWAMIVDNTGAIVDFVAWGWTDAEIQSLFINVNGFPVMVGSAWTGDAPVACATPNSVNRTGSADNNSALDFACEAETKGTQNANLAGVFNDCGLGLCGSPVVPVDITLVPGITVNLGNDTLVQLPFSFVIDAGSGYTSYLWSTSETTQSITVNALGDYWVSVTGANGCLAEDTIHVDELVKVETLITAADLEVFPNPASGSLILGGLPLAANREVELRDVSGKILLRTTIHSGENKISIDVSNIENGLYLVVVKSGFVAEIKKAIIQH